jgi:hypothetical protein
MELNETYTRIAEYIKSRPSETYGQIAAALGLSRATAARIARLQGIRRRAGKRAAALEAAVAVIDAASQRLPSAADALLEPAEGSHDSAASALSDEVPELSDEGAVVAEQPGEETAAKFPTVDQATTQPAVDQAAAIAVSSGSNAAA